MDPHDRYISNSNLERCFYLQTGTSQLATLSNLIDNFNQLVAQINATSHSTMYLRTLYGVLCTFYQTKVQMISNQKLDHKFNCAAFYKLNVSNAQKVLYTQQLKAELLSLVLDILVLHMTLYFDVPAVLRELEALQVLIHQHLTQDKRLQAMDVKLMDCHMNSLLLHQRSSSLPISGSASERVKELYLKNVKLQLTSEIHEESQLLTQFLPKLVKLFTAGDMLTKVWEMIFTPECVCTKRLSILHSTSHLWFPKESPLDKQLIDRSMEERLWLLLLRGLSSTVAKEREEALDLVEQVVDFADRHKNQALQFRDYREIRPLVCIGNVFQQDLFKENRNNWFLILQELEKNAEHFVTPAFFKLRNMLQDTSDIHGVHIAWIRCACVRILQDASNAVVRWGLLEVLTLDLKLFDDELLSVLTDALNQTCSYEIEVNEEKPTVVNELITFLNYAEAQNTDLVARFLVKASKITWKPICLFNVVHALCMVKRLQTVWNDVELGAVKSLAENILSTPCPILRIGSHIELLEAMTHFATGPLNLVTVANTLAAFPTSEVLIRDQLAWKRTSAWLSNTVQETEATLFLETICGQMADDKSPKDLSIKSLSLIVMLFYDGYVALNSKLSPGFTALCNLLNYLIEDESTLHVNTELKIRAIEVLDYLLDVTMSKDCILNELVSNYANATLRWTFMNLRTTFDEDFFGKMSTYVRITQQLFVAKSSIITKRDVLNHIQKFQVESCNIIENGEFDSKVKRFFGVKILHICLTATSTRLRNYNFIGSLHKKYKIQLTRPSRGAEGDNKTCKENSKLEAKFESEYYKLVAELFHEYLKDEPVDEWLPDVDWIKEVSYLIQVGGTDVIAPLVRMLSQIFYKQPVGATCMDDFKSSLRLCWKSILESNECGLAIEEILDLMLSPRFLESEETKELTIKCTREVMDKGDACIGQSIILLKKLKQVKGECLCDFYEAILACSLCGTVPSPVQQIELQARSYVLDCYQEVYPNYLSAMNSNTSLTARAHAITLLHKMITDDPAHAAKLLPLMIGKLDGSQKEQDVYGSQTHRFKTRVSQVLLVLQPMLNNGDIESLTSFLCNSILSEGNQPSVRIMQEWLLIRIYLASDNLRSKIWDLFDQCQARRVASLCSAMRIVYHVARLLSPDLQLDFINYALQRIMPYCMSQQSNVPVYAQVITNKLYDLATELSYSAITERYRDLQAALTESQKYGDLKTKSAELQDSFCFKNFHPIVDYTLQTLFYELPRALNVSWDELLPTQMFEKSGFRKVNDHPLKLLDPKNDTEPQQQMTLPVAVTISADSRKKFLKETSPTLES